MVAFDAPAMNFILFVYRNSREHAYNEKFVVNRVVEIPANLYEAFLKRIEGNNQNQ